MAQKILVIDDDQFIRDIYIEVLRNDGFEVDFAIDGIEGVDKIKKGGYDLILLDMVMPKLDGLGVLNTIQQNPPQTQNGPIILLTNREPDSTLEEGMKKGANAYLVKANLNPDQLVSEIKKFLAERGD